jgi:hypothetical protein
VCHTSVSGSWGMRCAGIATQHHLMYSSCCSCVDEAGAGIVECAAWWVRRRAWHDMTCHETKHDTALHRLTSEVERMPVVVIP